MEIKTIALADFLRNGNVVNRIHRQVQCDNAVAALDALQRVGVNAWFGE